MLLAEERGFASCSGEAQAAERESLAMRDALERAFLRIDAEILSRARAESARDGSCALVAVRIGAPNYMDRDSGPLSAGLGCVVCSVKA